MSEGEGSAQVSSAALQTRFQLSEQKENTGPVNSSAAQQQRVEGKCSFHVWKDHSEQQASTVLTQLVDPERSSGGRPYRRLNEGSSLG